MNDQSLHPNPTDRRPWGLRWALLFQLLAMGVVLLPPLLAKHVHFTHGSLDEDDNLLRFNVLFLLGLVVFAVYAVKRFKDLNWRESIRFLGFKKPVFRPVLVGLLSLAPILLLYLYQFGTYQDLLCTTLPVETVLPIVLDAVFEEIYFRGFLFRLLRRGRSFLAAAVLSGLFWAATHLVLFRSGSGFNAVDVALTMLTAFIFSFSLALLFEKSGNVLWGCMAIHAAYDLLPDIFIPNPDFNVHGGLPGDARLYSFIALILTGLLTWGLAAWLLPRSQALSDSVQTEMKLPNRENAVSNQWSFPLLVVVVLIGLVVGPSLMPQNQAEESEGVHSDEAAAHVNLGLALANGGQYDPAISEFQKAADLDPENPKAYTFWANCLIHQGKYQEAIPLLQKAAEIIPEEPAIYLYWGTALRDLGKYDEALLMFQETLKLSKDSQVITQAANEEIAEMKGLIHSP